MKIVKTLETPLPFHQNSVLAIGTFDGMHKGHLAVLQELKHTASETASLTALLTFENHPKDILVPNNHTKQICTLSHKIHLLNNIGIDLLLLLPFTHEFSQQTTDIFFQKMQNCLKFSHLVLGHDALLGRNREGNRIQVKECAESLGFTVKYVDPHRENDIVVSSTHIRKLIQQGQFKEIAGFLGRDYSIFGPVISGQNRGKGLGFPTANIDISQLILPPFGVYAVKVKHQNQLYRGVANLGTAPTIRNNPIPVLEVHLIDQTLNFYNDYIEVIFTQFIRPEKKFDNLRDLQLQIANDVDKAKQTLAEYSVLE